MFIDSNMNRLAKDMSVGEGESLVSLASLMGIEEKDRPLFFSETKNNFGYIFPNSEVTSAEVTKYLNVVLAGSPELSKYTFAG